MYAILNLYKCSGLKLQIAISCRLDTFPPISGVALEQAKLPV